MLSNTLFPFAFNFLHVIMMSRSCVCTCVLAAAEGLVPAMFLDSEGREVANEDPRCGLYIRSRRKVYSVGMLWQRLLLLLLCLSVFAARLRKDSPRSITGRIADFYAYSTRRGKWVYVKLSQGTPLKKVHNTTESNPPPLVRGAR